MKKNYSLFGTVEMKGERITLPVTLPALEERIHITVNGIAFNMIKVDDGTFTMGATSEMSDSWSNIDNCLGFRLVLVD